MTTISDLAAQFGLQAHEVQALADMPDVGQSDELTDEQEAHLRDLLARTGDDGVYEA